MSISSNKYCTSCRNKMILMYHRTTKCKLGFVNNKTHSVYPFSHLITCLLHKMFNYLLYNLQIYSGKWHILPPTSMWFLVCISSPVYTPAFVQEHFWKEDTYKNVWQGITQYVTILCLMFITIYICLIYLTLRQHKMFLCVWRWEVLLSWSLNTSDQNLHP